MAAQVLSFFDRSPRAARDWSQQDLAEFYRVESALLRAGVEMETDRGLSDEGEPWFVFCRADSGDVFIHFALIDGLYLADGAAFQRPVRNADFGALVRELIAHYPLARARDRAGSNIFVHPAALLIALVGAAFFHSQDAKAAETHESGKATVRKASLIVAAPAKAVGAVSIAVPQAWDDSASAQAAAVILSAVLALQDDLFAAPARDLALAAVSGLSLTAGLHGGYAPLTLGAAPEPVIHAAALDAMASAVVLPSVVHPAPPGSDIMALPALGLVADAAGQSHMISAEAGSDAVLSTLVADAPAPPTADSSKPVFLFKAMSLAAPATPTEAVSVAAAAAAEAGPAYDLANKAIPQVDALPSSLLKLINGGVHLADGGGETPAKAASDPGSSVALPSAPTSSPFPAAKAHDPAIDAAIAQFVSQVGHLEVLAQGKQLVLYDHDIFSPFTPDLNLTSVTYTFDDGSSVSLVGTAHELGYFG